MRRFTFIGLLLIGCACSKNETPNVSEAPHAFELEEAQADASSYVIDKADGLAIEVLVEGSGPLVRSGDLVTLHYRGTVLVVHADEAKQELATVTEAEAQTTEAEEEEEARAENVEQTDQPEEHAPQEENGETNPAPEAQPESYVFGDTFKHGIPLRITLRPGSAIKGWRKGLVGLKVGTRVVLEVPAELAYGREGMPNAKIPPNADLRYEIELLETGIPNRRR